MAEIVDNRTPARDYPLPNAENWLQDDAPRLVQALQAIDTDVAALLSQLALKAALAHIHAIGDVTGLQDALNARALATHSHALNDLSDVDVSMAVSGQVLKRVGSTWLPVLLQITDVQGLQAALQNLEPSVIDGGTFGA